MDMLYMPMIVSYQNEMSRRLGNRKPNGAVIPVCFLLFAAVKWHSLKMDPQVPHTGIQWPVDRLDVIYLTSTVHLQDDGNSNFYTVETPEQNLGVHTVIIIGLLPSEIQTNVSVT